VFVKATCHFNLRSGQKFFDAGLNPAAVRGDKNLKRNEHFDFFAILLCSWEYNMPLYMGFYGVVVSTLDFESSDLGSNPGRT
jgi:hypothetical protein